MRRILVGALLLVAGTARADLSGAAGPPGFPLGPRCARALTGAQARAGHGFTGAPTLQLGPSGAGAQFQVSDMCGVGGEGTLRLERDARPDARWHRLERGDLPDTYRARLTRRHAGWRAVIEITVEGLAPGDFEDAFREAVDVCFAELPAAPD
jgi:hypothetical protein